MLPPPAGKRLSCTPGKPGNTNPRPVSDGRFPVTWPPRAAASNGIAMLFSPTSPLAPLLSRLNVAGFATVDPGHRSAGTRRSSVVRRRTGGFTLIELMVVVMILGVLAALVVPRVMSRPDQARVVAAKADIARIDQQLKLYRLDNGRYPSTDQGLQALVTPPTSGAPAQNWKQYLDKVPMDPWGKPYQYLNPGVHGEIDIFSLGADGQPGGSGDDADIGSWDQ